MKEKAFKVKIPKGYEIDMDKSTFEKIVFKPVSQSFSYECVGDPTQEVLSFDTGSGQVTLKVGLYTSDVPALYSRMRKVLANYQLLNIAKYYNGDWKPDWKSNDDKYQIVSIKNGFMDVPPGFMVLTTRIIDNGTICFKNKEDAQAVIDNPNFQNILNDYFSRLWTNRSKSRQRMTICTEAEHCYASCYGATDRQLCVVNLGKEVRHEKQGESRDGLYPRHRIPRSAGRPVHRISRKHRG